MKPDSDLLARLGFKPGDVSRWCATCERTFAGATKAFTCLHCARQKARFIHIDELASGRKNQS